MITSSERNLLWCIWIGLLAAECGWWLQLVYLIMAVCLLKRGKAEDEVPQR